jgi:hypothetical protein
MQQEADYYGVNMDNVRAYARELSGVVKQYKDLGESDEEYHNRLLRSALDY